jgi:2-oxoglutarate ferredoxin oxidoreductase subunit alpha
MDDFSVLIAGKAGDGIDKAGSLIASILNQLGFSLYVYRDYPSIIRGGHTFSIIRASLENKSTCRTNVDFVLALNEDAIRLHSEKISGDGIILYNADLIKEETLSAGKHYVALPLEKMVKEENAQPVMRNSCIIGGFAKIAGIDWGIVETVFKKGISREFELNIKVARRGFDAAQGLLKLKKLNRQASPLITGNEALGLGLIKAGLDTYIGYPMTPLSNLLHFLAGISKDFSLDVIHPENEIAVILMALGFAYAGKRAAVGTSGGGFCLMTESLSLAGMAELPVVIIVGQRTGPSTGLPTYTGQSDLHFVLNAGHGEFSRFVVAPGDVQEAYFWAGKTLNIAWRYQVPAIILVDKTLCEGTYSFDLDATEALQEEKPLVWDRKGAYKRYLNTESGVSPLAVTPEKDEVIKVDSYEHDEFGITTEDATTTCLMQEKRLRKQNALLSELEKEELVKVCGKKDASTALLCWGSNKGICIEAAQRQGLKVIQPIVLSPFPRDQFALALKGVKKLISVENNITGQLERLINGFGYKVDERILKYDGRPFFLDELQNQLKKAI